MVLVGDTQRAVEFTYLIQMGSVGRCFGGAQPDAVAVIQQALDALDGFQPGSLSTVSVVMLRPPAIQADLDYQTIVVQGAHHLVQALQTSSF